MELAGLSPKHLIGIIVLVITLIIIGYVIHYLGTITIRMCRNSFCPVQRAPRADSIFPVDYQTARKNYVDAVTLAGGRLESIQNPEQGPAGEPLFMDVALFGNENAERMLVIGSGLHGVEGFAGSGIQTKLLREGIVQTLPSSVKLLMIHAINPYGMAHLRRFNEDNVDLNRNFRDFSFPIEYINDDYAELANVLVPDSITFWSEVRSWSRLLWLKYTKGMSPLQAAVEGGQYRFPKGLFYGGSSESWSNVTIRSVVDRHLIGIDQVVIVDFHTGLGEYGAAEIILDVNEESDEFNRSLAIWGPQMVRPGSKLVPDLAGSLKHVLSIMLSQRMEVTAVSLEFGTLPMMEVFIALRAENWLHHYGGPNYPRAREIKECLLRTFHPGTKEWEDAVWGKGKSVIEKALLYLK